MAKQNRSKRTTPELRADAQAPTREATATGRVGAGGEDIVVPVIEERLVTDTQWRDAGVVTIRLRTEEAPETVAEFVTREELEIEEVAVGRVLADGEVPAQRQEGDTTIIPVVEERLVMVKQHVLAKELRIGQRSRTETRELTETVRRQRVQTWRVYGEGLRVVQLLARDLWG